MDTEPVGTPTAAPLQLRLHALASAGERAAAERLGAAALANSLDGYQQAQLQLAATAHLDLGELTVPTDEDLPLAHLFFADGLHRAREMVGSVPVLLSPDLAGELVTALRRPNLTRHASCDPVAAERWLGRFLGRSVVTAFWPAGSELTVADGRDLAQVRLQMVREGASLSAPTALPAELTEAERMLAEDDEMARALTLSERLPAQMIDSVLLQPVNVPVALMGQYFYLPPAGLDVDLSALEPEQVAAQLAEIMERGAKGRVYQIDAYQPESGVGVGVIEEQMTYPGSFAPGTIFGPLGGGRYRRHPVAGLRRGMAVEDGLMVPGPAGALVPGHRMEFYREVRWISSTRVWRQIMARGRVDLVARQRDYMARHRQLSPTAVWSPERGEVVEQPASNRARMAGQAS
jgi:hypothetical protein